MRDPIDFTRLASALLDRADSLVPDWLPGGKRNGAEWECADLSGGKGTSLRVNLHTGKWADFATDDKGGDLISLYAAIHNIDNGTAARQLMEMLGWAQPQQRQATPAHRAQPAPASSRGQGADQAQDERPEPPADDDDKAKPRTTWTPIVPVPESAPAPDLTHWQRGKPEASWLYMVDGQLWGAVARYPTSDGGKDIVPWTWCQDTGDSRGLMKWHMKQWEEPRPLYLPAGFKPVDDQPRIIVVVEGEKCALALHNLLQAHTPDVYTVVSWPGGGKAWDKAAWEWLAPAFGKRPIVLWPDCDAKRMKLTKAERDSGVDVSTKPLLSADKQPGMVTMMGIARHLQGLGCDPGMLALCKIPEPGAVADGWDVADAIAQGWTPEQVEAFIVNAPTLDDSLTDQPLPAASAGQDEGRARKRDRTGWRDWLLTTDKGAIKACRENIVLALDGVPGMDVRGIPAAAGVIAFNEFTNNVVKLTDTPWGTKAGEWLEEDELEMGAWLVREHYLPSMPRTGLEEAVKMVAGRHRFHPVRQYLDTLKGKWDGQRRLRRWLKDVCRAQVPVGIQPEDNDKYLARVGSWLVMAMVDRVMRPGCKYDYMVIFEGKQGLGKSTLARALGGEWFADTGLVMGEKDAYQNLQGVWVYEIGELDSMSKAEVTKVKAFVSSEKDRFRASFDRRPRDYPRQVVFVGTTNEDHYLTDLTGNRRFWPVRVGGQIDVAWLREHRDQLFAEALHFLEEGHRFHPTTDEQRELFDPQQAARTVEPPIESRIVAYLYDHDHKVPHGELCGYLRNEITTSQLLSAIGVGIEKQVGADRLVKQAAAILKKLGWREGKSSAKGGARRVQVYKRPQEETATAQVQSHEDERATDDVPF